MSGSEGPRDRREPPEGGVPEGRGGDTPAGEGERGDLSGGPSVEGAPASRGDTGQGAAESAEPVKAKAPWIELPLAWISFLRTEISRQECKKEGADDPDRRTLISGARGHLRIAESACLEGGNRRRKSNRLERIWANVRAADVELLALNSDDELRARCGHIQAMVGRYIHEDSPQRTAAENALRRIMSDVDDSCGNHGNAERSPVSTQDRITVIHALGISYSALDKRMRQVRIFANSLWLATFLTFIGAAAIAVWGALDPQTVALCFEQPKGDIASTEETLENVIVCPTGEQSVVRDKPFVDQYADRWDVLSVELAGLVGAALTTIAALRRIHDDHVSPYSLPLAAATLKFPLGAISAFVGIIFIRGAFLPGLSALDTPIQILAWAVLFGAAQHLVTHLVDAKAQSTLSGIGRPSDPPPKTH